MDSGVLISDLVSTTLNYPIQDHTRHTHPLPLPVIVWAIFNGAVFVCIVGGNLLTITAVRSCRRLRSQISNYFILSLAISDLMVGLTLPYHVAFYLGSTLGQSHGLCLLRFCMVIFACCVSTMTLIAIAIDRFIAIVYALHYRNYMTRRVALAIITIIWSIGATVGVLPLGWNHWNNAHECEFYEVIPAWYIAGIITPAFILIWLAMFIIYWRIMREACKHAQQLNKSVKSLNPTAHISDWKSAQIVMLIMGCFTICYLPYFTVAMCQVFDVMQISPLLYKIVFSLAMTSSGINPIIYCWKNTNFRRAFILLLRCKSPNSHLHNMDLSQYSIRSHPFIARQQSMQDTTEAPITPLSMEHQGQCAAQTLCGKVTEYHLPNNVCVLTTEHATCGTGVYMPKLTGNAAETQSKESEETRSITARTSISDVETPIKCCGLSKTNKNYLAK